MRAELVNGKQLVAVLGASGQGVFFAGEDRTFYLNSAGRIEVRDSSLEGILNSCSGRKSVYKGDVVTLTF